MSWRDRSHICDSDRRKRKHFFRADPTVLTIFLIKSRSHERLINTTPKHAAHDFFHIKTNLAKYWEIVGANVRQGCVLSPRLFHTVLKCYAVSNAKMEFSHWTCKFGLDGWVALFHGFTFFKREFVFSQWEQCARTHTLKKKRCNTTIIDDEKKQNTGKKRRHWQRGPKKKHSTDKPTWVALTNCSLATGSFCYHQRKGKRHFFIHCVFLHLGWGRVAWGGVG